VQDKFSIIRRVLYHEYLKQNLGECPFCNTTDRKIISTANCYLTYALAPYHKHHLLVVPRKHRTSIFELNDDEKNEIDTLIEQGSSVLRRLGYTDFTIIVREGHEVGKSIDHLHYHIIPNTHIGDLDHNSNERRILTENEVAELTNEFHSVLPDAK
jgi:diadenosine tetraphosphate (Ap4A) HIT family hydrolase